MAIDSGEKTYLSHPAQEIDDAVDAVATKASAADLAAEVTAREKLQAAVTALVDGGSKNKMVLTDTTVSTKKGVTLTYNNDGTYTVDSNGEASSGSDYFYLARSASNPQFPKGSVISGCTGGSDSTYYIGIAGTSVKQGSSAVALNVDVSGSLIFSFASGITFDNLVLKPMVCSSADWNLSQEFEAYCPTLQELYEMILAMGGSRSVQSEPQRMAVDFFDDEEEETR